MSIFNNNLLAGAGAQSSGGATYSINQSIRFNAADSAYLNRTPSSAGNQKTWTLSWWFKRGNLATFYSFFNRRTGSGGATNVIMYLRTDDTLEFYISNGSTIDNPITTRVFRDTAAWYHCVATLDTTNVAVEERFRVYINGVRETLTGDTFLYDTNYLWNDAQQHVIGRQNYYNNYYLDAYMAEIVFIDGTSLNADSFGEYNSSGIWVPKNINDQSFTFGTNGFYIDGRDSADLGDDESGQGNDFTTSGLASDDQKTDSPTNNHATWNPLTNSAQVYTNGNLNAATASSAWKGGLTTAQVPLNSGTWYYEIYVDSAGASSGQFSIGWAESNRSVSDDNSSGDTEGWVTYAINGSYYSNGGSGSLGATYTTGDVIGCKIDTDSSTNNVEFYKNGASQGTRSQAFNTGGTGFISPYILLYGTRNATARFAQAEWTQTPSGITTSNAINTKNIGS
jgi:hypothetical protein